MALHQNIRAILLWVCVVSFAYPSVVHAQYNTCQNRIWTFGYHDGIDFCSGVPVSYNSADSVREGCATLSDENGIVFYTDGNSVYNKHDTVMPNGAAILPPSFLFCGSSTQGALIAPTIKNPNQYYIFSLGSLDVFV
ncbi:MAG TPA: hypothetical protein VHA52_00415, partial [Candidatus Babeliaceae bacterium]|nr:hypothetical protein [Candidatus Babeliaceae bacterium]